MRFLFGFTLGMIAGVGFAFYLEDNGRIFSTLWKAVDDACSKSNEINAESSEPVIEA